MPGENCAVFGCGTCRNQKDLAIFKVPTAKDEVTRKWRSEMLSIITRDREMDAKFKRLIEKDKVYICERHFELDQLWICKYYLYFGYYSHQFSQQSVMCCLFYALAYVDFSL